MCLAISCAVIILKKGNQTVRVRNSEVVEGKIVFLKKTFLLFEQ